MQPATSSKQQAAPARSLAVNHAGSGFEASMPVDPVRVRPSRSIHDDGRNVATAATTVPARSGLSIQPIANPLGDSSDIVSRITICFAQRSRLRDSSWMMRVGRNRTWGSPNPKHASPVPANRPIHRGYRSTLAYDRSRTTLGRGGPKYFRIALKRSIEGRQSGPSCQTGR